MYDTKSFNFRLESLTCFGKILSLLIPGIEFNSKKGISLAIINLLAKPDNLRFSNKLGTSFHIITNIIGYFCRGYFIVTQIFSFIIKKSFSVIISVIPKL